jgi:O-antigen/teichoic acid export membrane protein
MIKKSLAANYIGQSWSSILTVIFLPVYAKYIGQEGIGLIGIYTSLQICLNIFDLGMTPTIIREIARVQKSKFSISKILNLLKTIELISLLISLLIILTFYFTSDYFSTQWIHGANMNEVDIKNIFILIGILSATRIIEGIYRGALVGLQEHIKYNLIISIATTLRTAGVVCLFQFVSPTLFMFFYWQIIVSILSIGILKFTLHSTLPKSDISGKFSFDSLLTNKRYSLSMFGISILSLLITQTDKILLSRLLNLSEYGFYTLAMVAASSVYMLIFPISQTWFPIFSKLHAEKKNINFAANFHKASQLVTILAGSATITLVIFTHNFSNIWLQNENSSNLMITLIRFLVIGNFLNGLTYVPYNAQLACGWTSLGLKNNVLSILIIIPMLFLVVPKYGSLGAALIWVGLNLFYIFGPVNFMFNHILKRQRYEWFINDTIKPFTAATITTLIFCKILDQLPIHLNDMIILILAACISLLSSILASKLIRTDCIRLLRNIKK